jgi:hypothetical protein
MFSGDSEDSHNVVLNPFKKLALVYPAMIEANSKLSMSFPNCILDIVEL